MKKEKSWQEKNGDYHHGVPANTVIVDGGWYKRSHKHSQVFHMINTLYGGTTSIDGIQPILFCCLCSLAFVVAQFCLLKLLHPDKQG